MNLAMGSILSVANTSAACSSNSQGEGARSFFPHTTLTRQRGSPTTSSFLTAENCVCRRLSKSFSHSGLAGGRGGVVLSVTRGRYRVSGLRAETLARSAQREKLLVTELFEDEARPDEAFRAALKQTREGTASTVSGAS